MSSVSYGSTLNKLLISLNDAQKSAVTFNGGHLLVLAGAGSGKTKVLTHRAAYFMSEKKVSPPEYLSDYFYQ